MIFHLMMKTFPDIPGKGQTQNFSFNNISGSDLPFDENDFNQIVQIIKTRHEVSFGEIEVIFVDEPEIIRINKTHLKRDYVTDIISFNYNEPGDHQIDGSLFCCAQRITEQSKEFESDPRSEYIRVVAHGLLHLIGYDDKSPDEKETMTKLENEILELMNPDIT